MKCDGKLFHFITPREPPGIEVATPITQFCSIRLRPFDTRSNERTGHTGIKVASRLSSILITREFRRLRSSPDMNRNEVEQGKSKI